MQYLGSKNKIAKQILPLILKDRQPNQYFIDIFCGGCNIIDKVDGPRFANDNNKYLIEMWRSLQKGWIPPTFLDKDRYNDLRQHQDLYPPALVGFAGFLCSFGGKWFGGYAHNSKGDNYAERGSRCLVKQIKNLQDVIFFNCDYKEFYCPPNSIIYADPPYEGTTKYKDKFNHKEFWDWCRKKNSQGHKIFISEYNAPDDFKCIMEIPVKTVLDRNSQDKKYQRIERLFVPNF